MSRSFRKSPCKSYTNAGSSKAWKAKSNQRHRHNQKQLIKKVLESADWDNFIPRVVKDDSNIWDSPKDGKPNWELKPHENVNTWYWTYEERLKEWEKVFRK